LWLDRWRSASRSATWPALWSTLDTWPGQLQLHVGQLGWRGLRLVGAEASLSHQDGVIRLASLDARLWDGRLNASGEWRLADGRWQLVARAGDADLALLRQTLAERPPGGPPTPRQGDAASGRWSGVLSLSGQQDDVRAWQGNWSVEARAGHWQGLDLRAARQAAHATPRTPEPSERTDWRRLLATGTVAGGVAHIDQFQLQQPAGRLAADGTLDLETGELALAWSDLAGTRKRGPVLSMTGPWRAPLTRLP